MKNLILFAILFSFTINAAQAQYNDPTPQSAQSDELRFMNKVLQKMEYTELDSSDLSKGLERKIVVFDGIKLQIRKNSGNLSTVTRWEYRHVQTPYGDATVFIFHLPKGGKEVVSLRPMDKYREITLHVLSDGCEEKIAGYIPHTVPNKEVTKITLRY